MLARQAKDAQIVQGATTNEAALDDLPHVLLEDVRPHIPPEQLEPPTVVPVQSVDRPPDSSEPLVPRRWPTITVGGLESPTTATTGETRATAGVATTAAPPEVAVLGVPLPAKVLKEADGPVLALRRHIVRALTQGVVPSTKAERTRGCVPGS